MPISCSSLSAAAMLIQAGGARTDGAGARNSMSDTRCTGVRVSILTMAVLVGLLVGSIGWKSVSLELDH